MIDWNEVSIGNRDEDGCKMACTGKATETMCSLGGRQIQRRVSILRTISYFAIKLSRHRKRCLDTIRLL